jgi:hypothetical protein
MRSLIFISLLLAGIIFTGCKKDPDEQRLSWSTEAPLSIPYRQRIQRLEKKNLLRNCSFETGKILKVDSLKTSFVIDGWQQTGEHVEWVDTRNENLYRKNEAFNGYRSIKIVRHQANETDKQGEGVLSEFIKVIPGNYSFSFYTRLEKVMPVRSRLGIRMYDGVDIRLLFFDRNKNEIDAEADFPQLRQSIDNSFKSLSFANFSTIPDFEWGRIIGKSADFPFPDGDIPTNAHYVKIYIGLKGTGTIWIDSVDFSYTRKNFSVEERMMGFTDTSMQVPLVIIPTPKKIERQESVDFFKTTDTSRLPLIIIPVNADITTRKAGNLLQQALSSRVKDSFKKNEKIPVVRIISDDHAKMDNKRLVFILGKTSLYPEFQEALPLAEIAGHSQGYYVYTPNDLPNVVFLGGNNSQGIYYAVLSAMQLIDGKQPVFHNAQIIDFPDFENRYFTLGDLPDQHTAGLYADISGELAAYKINGAFYSAGKKKDLLKESSLHVYKDKAFQQPLFGLGIIVQDKTADPGINADRMVFAPRWILPEDSTLSYPEFMNLSFSDSSIPPQSMLIAPVYNNYLLDYLQFMNQVSLNSSSTTHFYSGSSFFSMNTDDADFARYFAYAHSKPVFMDNSMLTSCQWGQYNGSYPYYPGKIRLFSIIEPFMNAGIRDHLSKLDTSMYWINQAAISEIDVIRLATAADFMWNTRDYDPDYSLWKVLVSRYGVDAARELIHYANQYGLVLETELKLQRNEQVQRNLKNIREVLTVLSVSTRNLEKWLGSDHPLMKDIRSLNTLLKARLEHLTSSKVSNP